MKFDIVTIFPKMIDAGVAEGVISRGIAGGLIDLRVHDLREIVSDPLRQPDGHPVGVPAARLPSVQDGLRQLREVGRGRHHPAGA